jgi:choline dehydrogenase
MGVIGFLISVLRPTSAGMVRLKSSDPHEFPSVDLGFLSAESDYKICRSALRLSMAYAEEISKSGYCIRPLNGVVPDSFQDNDLDAFTRRWGKSIFHYSSSCRMAPEYDPRGPGVVDDELRVHGVKGLRIADASVFPRSSSAHPMAPVLMFAERCADMILSSL